jgi:hypothetical protein
MDVNLQEALMSQAIAVRPAVPSGTRQASGADVLVSYVDVWKWDMAMYLQRITITMYDSASGDLMISARWADSPMHAFRDSRLVVKDLIDDMFKRVRLAPESTGTPVTSTAK